MKDGANDEEGEAQFVDEKPVDAGDVSELYQSHVFSHQHEKCQFAQQRIQHVIHRMKLLKEKEGGGRERWNQEMKEGVETGRIKIGVIGYINLQERGDKIGRGG